MNGAVESSHVGMFGPGTRVMDRQLSFLDYQVRYRGGGGSELVLGFDIGWDGITRNRLGMGWYGTGMG